LCTQSKKGRVNRVGAILDHVTQFRPEADFVKLCDALAATNQEHVVRQYLSRDQQFSESTVAVQGRPAASSTSYSQPGIVVDAWRTVLVQSRSTIIELMDSSDEFVDRLVTYGVMNFATGELCRVTCISCTPYTQGYIVYCCCMGLCFVDKKFARYAPGIGCPPAIGEDIVSPPFGRYLFLKHIRYVYAILPYTEGQRARPRFQ